MLTAVPVAGSANPPFAPMNTDPNAAPARAFDVSDADFEASVIERSFEVPVLLDCWAPWCGPCRALTPLLEKLVDAYQGRFLLAKLNSDDNPGLAGALKLRSIPAVFLLIGGQVAAQFQGALPEGKLREFLDKHLPPAGEAPPSAESAIAQIREQAALADDATAAEMLRGCLEHEPGNLDLRWDLAERLISLGEAEATGVLLDSVAQDQRTDRHTALQARIALIKNRPPGDKAVLAARIAANPKDFDARLDLGALQAWEGAWGTAIDTLLEVVLRDKAEWRERARLQLVAWFAMCPDADAVSRGRRYLGMYLN